MAASSESMWSDYEVDYILAGEEAAERHEEWEREQRELRKHVSKEAHEGLVALGKRHGIGEPSYWCKHGYARAYFRNGSHVKIGHLWDWSKS